MYALYACLHLMVYTRRFCGKVLCFVYKNIKMKWGGGGWVGGGEEASCMYIFKKKKISVLFMRSLTTRTSC